jgi:hypothetical protein
VEFSESESAEDDTNGNGEVIDDKMSMILNV